MTQSASADALFVETAFAKSLLSREEADRVLEQARSSGRPASDVLVTEGLITQRTRDAIAQDVERSSHAKTMATEAPPSTDTGTGDPSPAMFQFSEADADSRTAVHPTGSGVDDDGTITESPMPEILGDYKVLRKLGEGGMGAVYQGEDTKLGRIVALKVLAPHYAKDRLAKDRFLREARVSASINHPNVITVHGVGEQDGLLFMALEFLEGGDAADLIDRFPGGVPERRALEVIRDCARGLVAIEKAGLVHRDIKPANIFITSDGLAKLADMGLARSQVGDDRMTMTGAIVGTPAYMAPEQARGDKELDIRTDIYALGAALYALTTSAPPFRGTSAWVVVSNVLSEPVPDPRTTRPGLSQPLSKLVCRALAKEPDDRFPSAAAFLEAVEAALAASPSGSAPPAAVPPSTSQPSSGSGRRISKSGSVTLAAPGSRASSQHQRTVDAPPSRPGSSAARRAPTQPPVVLRPPAPPSNGSPFLVGAVVLLIAGVLGFAYVSYRPDDDAVADGATTETTTGDADSTSALVDPPAKDTPPPEQPVEPPPEKTGDDLVVIDDRGPPQDPTPPGQEPVPLKDDTRRRPRRAARTRLPRRWKANPSIPPVLRAKPRSKGVKVGFYNDRVGVWPAATQWGAMTLTDRSKRSVPRGVEDSEVFQAISASFELRADVDANATKAPKWLRARGYRSGPQPGFYAHLGLRASNGTLKDISKIEDALWATLRFTQRADGDLDVDGMVRMASDGHRKLALGRGVEKLGDLDFRLRPGEPLRVQVALNQTEWVVAVSTPSDELVFEKGAWRDARGAALSRRTLRGGMHAFGDLGNWSDGYGWANLRPEIETRGFVIKGDRLTRFEPEPDPEPARPPRREPRGGESGRDDGPPQHQPPFPPPGGHPPPGHHPPGGHPPPRHGGPGGRPPPPR